MMMVKKPNDLNHWINHSMKKTGTKTELVVYEPVTISPEMIEILLLNN
jgi:hypothetical protein